jgi:hypothetical protein
MKMLLKSTTRILIFSIIYIIYCFTRILIMLSAELIVIALHYSVGLVIHSHFHHPSLLTHECSGHLLPIFSYSSRMHHRPQSHPFKSNLGLTFQSGPSSASLNKGFARYWSSFLLEFSFITLGPLSASGPSASDLWFNLERSGARF